MKVPKIPAYIAKMYKVSKVNKGRQSLLLLGKPGIGKSFASEQAARLIAEQSGKEFIAYDDDKAEMILADPDKYFVFLDLRLTECEPSDLIGIPDPVIFNGLSQNCIRFSPLLWARVLSRCAGLLLLDELTNISRPDMISASFKLFFDMAAGMVKFHEDVMVMAAGNRPEDSSVANMIPNPLISRLCIINITAPTIDEWASWMYETYEDGWDSRAYAFLKRFNSDGVYSSVPTKSEGLEAYPVPRTWTAVSVLGAAGVTDAETIDGLIGGVVGTKFRAFCKINVSLDEILSNPKRFAEVNLDAQYMVSVMLGNYITKNIKKKKAIKKTFGMVDEMDQISREFILLALMTMKRNTIASYLRELFDHNEDYNKILSEITLHIRSNLTV